MPQWGPHQISGSVTWLPARQTARPLTLPYAAVFLSPIITPYIRVAAFAPAVCAHGWAAGYNGDGIVAKNIDDTPASEAGPTLTGRYCHIRGFFLAKVTRPREFGGTRPGVARQPSTVKQASTRRWTNAGLSFVQRLKSCANDKPATGQRLVFDGKTTRLQSRGLSQDIGPNVADVIFCHFTWVFHINLISRHTDDHLWDCLIP